MRIRVKVKCRLLENSADMINSIHEEFVKLYRALETLFPSVRTRFLSLPPSSLDIPSNVLERYVTVMKILLEYAPVILKTSPTLYICGNVTFCEFNIGLIWNVEELGEIGLMLDLEKTPPEFFVVLFKLSLKLQMLLNQVVQGLELGTPVYFLLQDGELDLFKRPTIYDSKGEAIHGEKYRKCLELITSQVKEHLPNFIVEIANLLREKLSSQHC